MIIKLYNCDILTTQKDRSQEGGCFSIYKSHRTQESRLAISRIKIFLKEELYDI